MRKQSKTKKKKENLTEVEKRSIDIAKIMAEEDINGNVPTVEEIACTLTKRERRKRNMQNSYLIEKDPTYKMWVVWEIHKNLKVEIFKAKLKRECKKWLEEKVK